MNNARRTKLLLLTSILLISSTLILTTTLFPLFQTPRQKPTQKLHHTNHLQKLTAAQTHCQGTLHKSLCISTLSTFPDLHKKTIPEIISGIVNITVNEVYASETNCSGISHTLRGLNSIQQGALADCLELLDQTIDELQKALSCLHSSNDSSTANNDGASKYHDDIQSVLSGAMTNQDTCINGFEDGHDKEVQKIIKPAINKIAKHVSNSLAMMNKIPKSKEKKYNGGGDNDGFPEWMSGKDRRLLQAPVSNDTSEYDAVVAKDGSGNYSTVSEAVAAAPNKTETRYVIYIKQGTYFENVEVDKKKTNLMFVGDGMGKTVIKAGRSVKRGYTTFRSATVAVVGSGFIAKGITFENSAGPENHQAVALRSGSDFSAFYNCSFIAYQDTLYVHSMRQFYRECDIYGTVDFIFGDAAVVFQKCSLYARKPSENQKNMFTAQGRKDPNENTGISIINSKVAAASDLLAVQSSFKSYLGRPWKEYSRTVYLNCYIGDFIDPAGWHEWSGDFALDTLYYGEYMNRGPGANTSDRVTWPGYRVINSSSVADQFTVDNFIEGGVWLPEYDIPFDLGL